MRNKTKKFLVSFICVLLAFLMLTMTACSSFPSFKKSTSSTTDDEPIKPDDPNNADLDDYVSDAEDFVYSLIYSDLTKQYDTFVGYVTIPSNAKNAEPVEVYGITYVDYEEGYIDENGKTYFSAGFISFPDATIKDKAIISTGAEIISLEDEYDEFFSYVYSYSTEDIHMHCVIDNMYVKYDIVNGVLQYSEEPYTEGMNVDSSRGNIYNYDTEEYVYIVGEQNYIPVSGVSLLGEADYQDIMNEVNRIFETQELNLTYAEIESFVSQSQEALYSYLLGLQEETFLGIPTADLIEIAKDLDPMQHLQIGVTESGATTLKIIEITQLPSIEEKILTSIVCALGVVGGFVCTVVGLPVIGGTIMGAAMEAFSQVVVNNTPVSDIQWSQVAISAVAGAIGGGLSKAIASIAANGMGQLILREVADTLCDSLVNGGEFFVGSLIAGCSFEDACKNFGYGVIAGAIVSGATKIGAAAFKGGVKLIKKAGSSSVSDVAGKPVTKLSNNVTEDGFSELQEKAIYKAAKDGAEDALTDSVEELQEKANSVSRAYNKSRRVFEKAKSKGLKGITETANGGVSFSGSKYMYKLDDGTEAIVKIKATGNRASDFDLANKKLGFKNTPEGYVWHHLDDLDISSGELTVQLITTDAHLSIVPHAGGCSQYDAVFGPSYNPPRKRL